jgi:hypothetical protein
VPSAVVPGFPYITYCPVVAISATRRSATAKRLRPNEAITELANSVPPGQVGALMDAACRIAVLDAAPYSDATKVSALRSWTRFNADVLRKLGGTLPPNAQELATWALTFQNGGTFQNYLGAVKSECIALGLSVVAWSHPLVGRSIAAVKKREIKEAGTPAIPIEQLLDLVRVAQYEGNWYSGPLYVLSYWFLLRVPSEGLPLVMSKSSGDPPQHSKQIRFKGNEVTLAFGRRKNLENPSYWTRSCKCSVSAEICPVHVLAAFTAKMAEGTALFPRLTKDAFNTTLRRRAFAIQMAEAGKVSSKAFRRGHSRDLHAVDCPSTRLMRYAGWNGRATFNYVPLQAVVERAINKPAPTRKGAAKLYSDDEAEAESDSPSSS